MWAVYYFSLPPPPFRSKTHVFVFCEIMYIYYTHTRETPSKSTPSNKTINEKTRALSAPACQRSTRSLFRAQLGVVRGQFFFRPRSRSRFKFNNIMTTAFKLNIEPDIVIIIITIIIMDAW